MDSFLLVILLLTSLIVGLLTFLWQRFTRIEGVPGLNGLLSLPFVGHNWLLGPNSLRKVLQLRDEYGNIFRCDIGPLPTLIFADFETIKRVASLEGALGKPQRLFHTYRALSGLSYHGSLCGVYLNEGNSWREQRSFLSRHVYSSSGKLIYERATDNFVKELIKNIRMEPLIKDPKVQWTALFNNLLWRTIAGSDLSFKENEEAMSYLLDSEDKLFGFMSSSSLWTLLHMNLAFMTPLALKMGWKNVIDLNEPLENILKNEFKTIISSNNERTRGSYITEALKKTRMSRESGDLSGLNRDNEEYRHLLASVYSMLESEIDYLNKSIAPEVFGIFEWVLYFLSRHPRIQQRIFNELNAVANQLDIKLFRWEHRHKLPYTMACIEEAKRLAHFLPLSLPRMTERDVILDLDNESNDNMRNVDKVNMEKKRKIAIPKGTQLIFLSRHVQTDPDFYTQPLKFEPERHLNANKEFVADERVLVCGVGKRKCVGDKVAKAMIAVTVANVVHNFEVGTEDKIENTDDFEYEKEYLVGPLYRPLLKSPFVFEPRH